MAEYDVATDAEGNTYILSEEAMTVFVVSASGELLDSIGRRGAGPGEFSNPAALDVADQILHVYDRAGRVSRWRLPGHELLPIYQIGDYLAMSGRFRGTADGFVASEGVWNGSQNGGDKWEWYVARWNERGKTRVASGPVSTYTPFESPPCIAGVVMPPIFRPKLVWDLEDEVMVVASHSDYTVKILRDSQVVGKLTGNTPPRRVTGAMLRREIGDLAWGPPGRQCVIPAEQVIEGRGYAEFLAPIGNLWLLAVPNG